MKARPDAVKVFYDQFSTQYDRIRFSKRYYAETAAQEVAFVSSRVKPGARVLEVGAGTGRFTSALADKASYVLATDISVRMLEELRSKVQCSNVETLRMDLWKLDDLLEYGAFDTVVCMRVLPHLMEVQQALSKLKGAVKPQGNVVFDLWNHLSFVILLRRVLRRKSNVYTSYHSYSEMVHMIANAGMTVLTSYAWGYPRLFHKSLDSLGNRFAKSLGYAILFDCVLAISE